MREVVTKLYRIKEKAKGCYVTGIRINEQLIDVTYNKSDAKVYREEEVKTDIQIILLLATNNSWGLIDTGETITLHYTENVNRYKDAVIDGILAKFSDREKSGPHPVTYKYIEDMISTARDENGEWDAPYPEVVEGTWDDYYQNNEAVEDAVEKMYPGCRRLYNGHMSVL